MNWIGSAYVCILLADTTQCNVVNWLLAFVFTTLLERRHADVCDKASREVSLNNHQREKGLASRTRESRTRWPRERTSYLKSRLTWKQVIQSPKKASTSFLTMLLRGKTWQPLRDKEAQSLEIHLFCRSATDSLFSTWNSVKGWLFGSRPT